MTTDLEIIEIFDLTTHEKLFNKDEDVLFKTVKQGTKISKDAKSLRSHIFVSNPHSAWNVARDVLSWLKIYNSALGTVELISGKNGEVNSSYLVSLKSETSILNCTELFTLEEVDTKNRSMLFSVVTSGGWVSDGIVKRCSLRVRSKGGIHQVLIVNVRNVMESTRLVTAAALSRKMLVKHFNS